MLNSKNERELAYVVRVDDVKPIEGRDRVECAVVGGWTIMVPKGQFYPGSLGIYFEIDSQVPEKEPFMFLAQKKFKIKTQKYKTPNGQFWSQGLLMAPEDFNWYMNDIHTAIIEMDATNDEGYHAVDNESRFLTKRLGVTYAVGEDNARKSGSMDKYKKMAQRNPKFFAKKPIRWLMRRDWGKKLLFVLFGKKKDKKSGWPAWVKKTDEERVQNMPWILQNKEPWIATEKIDGTSTTFTMKRGKFGKFDFYVCSRNVVFDKPDKACFYDSNVYLEMAERYDIENALKDILKNNPELEWVTIQGETYGPGIQKRDYSSIYHEFAAFNFITSTEGRWNPVKAKEVLSFYGMLWVPIISKDYILPYTVEELLDIATDISVIDGFMRDGLVFRSLDGTQSFKAVSNEFLMKYHNG